MIIIIRNACCCPRSPLAARVRARHSQMPAPLLRLSICSWCLCSALRLTSLPPARPLVCRYLAQARQTRAHFQEQEIFPFSLTLFEQRRRSNGGSGCSWRAKRQLITATKLLVGRQQLARVCRSIMNSSAVESLAGEKPAPATTKLSCTAVSLVRPFAARF